MSSVLGVDISKAKFDVALLNDEGKYRCKVFANTSAGFAALEQWLQTHLPDRAAHVMSTVQQLRGGRDYDSRFGTRLRGKGVYADLLARRFALALKRFGFEGRRHPPFDCTRFVPPRAASPQGELF